MYIKKFKDILYREGVEYFIDEYEIDIKKGKSKIESIIDEMKERFIYFLEEEFSFEYKEVIDTIVEDGKSHSILEDDLIDRGFLFFDDEDNTLIPEELYSLIDVYYTKEKKLELLKNIIDCYLIINDIIPIDFIEKNYIDRFNLNITIEEMKNKYNIFIEDDYIVFKENTNVEEIKKYVTKKDYRILDNDKLNESIHLYKTILDKINGIVKDNDIAYYLLTIMFANSYEEPKKIFNNYLKSIKKEKYLDKITNIYLENIHDIRFKLQKGRNINDLFFDDLKDNAIKLDRKEDFDLNLYFKNNHFYEEIEDVKNNILKSFRKINELDIYSIKLILNDEVDYDSFNFEKTIKYCISIAYIDGKYVYVIPRELQECINDQEKLKNELLDKLEDEYIELVINTSNYIDANGIISFEELLDCLNKSGVDIDFESLKKYIDLKKFNVVNNYILDDSIDEEMIKDIEPIRNKIRYNKILKSNDYLNFRDTLEIVLFEYDIHDEYLINDLNFLAKMHILDKKELNNVLRYYNIYLNNKDILAIYNEIKDLLDDIPLWGYKGYSFNEINN